VTSGTWRRRGTTMQARQCCIGKSGPRRDWRTRFGMRRTYSAKHACLWRPNRSMWKLWRSTGNREKRPSLIWQILCEDWPWRMSQQVKRMLQDRSSSKRERCMRSATFRQGSQGARRNFLHARDLVGITQASACLAVPHAASAIKPELFAPPLRGVGSNAVARF